MCLGSEKPSPKSRLSLVSQYHMCDISHLRFLRVTNRKRDISHLRFVKQKNKNKTEARDLNFLFPSEGRDIRTVKKRISNLSLRLWRVIWKGRFRTWIQWKVSTHFLQNWFQFLFLFVNFIFFVIFNTNLIKKYELNQALKY